MPIYSGFPASGAKDWDDASYVATALTMYQTVETVDNGGGVVSEQYGYASLNTSAVTTGGTITAATLTFRNLSKETANSSVNVYLWSGTSDAYSVHAYTRGAGSSLAAGNYITTALTSSAQLACINVSGGTETALLFRVLTTPDDVNIG
jgi:hypothetical protein